MLLAHHEQEHDLPRLVLRVVGRMTAEGSVDGVPPLRSVVGQVAPEVASVIIEREEGEPVTATVSGGYFLAWWPSSADIVRITAYDEDDNALGSIEGPHRLTTSAGLSMLNRGLDHPAHRPGARHRGHCQRAYDQLSTDRGGTPGVRLTGGLGAGPIE